MHPVCRPLHTLAKMTSVPTAASNSEQATFDDLSERQLILVRGRFAVITKVDFPLVHWQYLTAAAAERLTLPVGSDEALSAQEIADSTHAAVEKLLEPTELHRHYSTAPGIFRIRAHDRVEPPKPFQPASRKSKRSKGGKGGKGKSKSTPAAVTAAHDDDDEDDFGFAFSRPSFSYGGSDDDDDDEHDHFYDDGGVSGIGGTGEGVFNTAAAASQPATADIDAAFADPFGSDSEGEDNGFGAVGSVASSVSATAAASEGTVASADIPAAVASIPTPAAAARDVTAADDDWEVPADAWEPAPAPVSASAHVSGPVSAPISALVSTSDSAPGSASGSAPVSAPAETAAASAATPAHATRVPAAAPADPIDPFDAAFDAVLKEQEAEAAAAAAAASGGGDDQEWEAEFD